MDNKTLNDEEITLEEFSVIPKDLRLLILNEVVGTRPFEVEELDDFAKNHVNKDNMIGLFCTSASTSTEEHISYEKQTQPYC